MKKTVLVTGADRGIGAALCAQAAARGDRAIGSCFGDGETLRAQGVEAIGGIDVASRAAVSKLVERLAGARIDVLIHNAGVVRESKLGRFDFEGFIKEYEVNALAPLRVTEALLPNLGEGSKIGIITSRVGSLGENSSGGLYGYRMSKAAANMAGMCLAIELKARGIAVMSLHPGTVLTDMTRSLGDTTTMGAAIEPAVAAQGLWARIEELTLETSGSFRHANGATLPW